MRRVDQKFARCRLMAMIEKHALTNRLPLVKAGAEIVAAPENFGLVRAAMGGWYRGKQPDARIIRSWRNPKKVKYAGIWPDKERMPELLTEFGTWAKVHYWLSPYLPLKERFDHVETFNRRKFFGDLIAAGNSYKSIAESYKIPLSTLYRWLPARKASSSDGNLARSADL